MTQCPKCESTDIRLSRCKSAWESWRKHVLAASPYRCGRCNWRGWISDPVPDPQPRAPRRRPAQVGARAAISFAAAPPRRDELDFHVLNLPRGPLYSHGKSF